MKQIFKVFFVVSCLYLTTGCSKADNYPGPDAGFQGMLTDSITGKPFLTETGGFQMKMEQISYSDNPSPYYIPSKPDGSFEDTRIFSGQYKVTPTQGAFWPADSTLTDIDGMVTQNFTVVPYLEIEAFSHQLLGDTLVMKFKLMAPKTEGLPQIIDLQPFVNNTPFVGSGATIYSQYTAPNIIPINSQWSNEIAQTTYTVKVPGLVSGRTFYARVGVRVDDSYKKFNLSEEFKVEVP